MPVRRIYAIASLVVASGLGGCAASRQPAAAMAVFHPNRSILTLGAGDSLGTAVYVNDLVIATGSLPADLAVTAAADELPISIEP